MDTIKKLEWLICYSVEGNYTLIIYVVIDEDVKSKCYWFLWFITNILLI